MIKKFIKRTNTKKDVLALVLSVLVVLFVLNFLSSRHFFRVDLTADDQFTLSSSTKNILKNLDDVVNVTLYFSKDLPPAIAGIKQDIDDTLDEYKTYAGSNLHVKFVDPQETPQMEQQVMMMGIPPVQVNVLQKDKQELAKLFLGVAITHEDKKEIIPVVQNPRNLEYDLTSAILKVSRKETPIVKWFDDGEKDNFKTIHELLKKRYTVEDVVSGKVELDPVKTSLLVVAREDAFAAGDLKAIDEYLAAGGKVIVLADLLKVENNLQSSQVQNNINDWLKNYGVTIEDKLVLDRTNAYAAFSGGYMTYHIPYPFWVKIVQTGFDTTNPIVSSLEAVILPWTSPVKIADQKPADVAYTVIARTSPFSATVPLDTALTPESAQASMPQVPLSEGLPVAVLATGRFTPDAKDATLLVVSNTRFIRDNFLQQFAANSIFFENSVDYLSMGSDLIGIRSKGLIDRPLEEVSPAGMAVTKYLNMLTVPAIIILIGGVIVFFRRQRSNLIKTIYHK